MKQTKHTIHSPDQSLTLHTGVENSRIWYSLFRKDGEVVIAHSELSLYAENDKNILTAHGELIAETTSFDETWEQPWGEQRYIHNNYNELSLHAEHFVVRFRLFSDSLGFRYELKGEGELEIHREQTEFNITPDSHAWWIPALGKNHYEHLYKKTLLSNIDTAHTPLTIEKSDGSFIAIHEAALYEYGSMNLVPTETGLMSSITPLMNGSAARITLPFNIPWRTVILSPTAAGLGVSKIMLNLNEPSRITDQSWIKPMKFMGIWWGMFIGYYTWASGEQHGATTANALRYINAAKKLGISGLLIEGWNETWDGDWTQNGDRMDHMQPYADFDIHAVTAYARSLDIEIVGHHETSGNISHYEWELPEAYDYYRLFGVNYIKTGYVAPRLNTGDFHSSQIGVRHYQKTVELAAERKIMLDIHEPVKGTGVERTWPNLLTREGVMGQEYEGGAVTPEHATVLPFTRSLAGPFDYTPGLFNLSKTRRKIQTTLAKQLAFYVTMYSPMQMVSDLPEHYIDHPAFEFIQVVPVDWDVTIPLQGAIGDYYIVARKDRNSDAWYVGGVSDEQARTVTIELSFLREHQTYEMSLYRDGPTSHWHDNPEDYEIERREVTSLDSVEVYIAPGGGFAISLKPANETPQPYPAY